MRELIKFRGVEDLRIPMAIVARHAANQRMPLADAEVVAEELAKFLFVGATSRQPCVPSRVVDAIWHEFLDDPSSYEVYCRQCLGRHVAHIEGTTGERSRAIYMDTVARISSRFGKPNESIWPPADALDGVLCSGNCSDK
jgi:hypothetical protein